MGAPKGNQGIYKITSPTNRIYIGQTVNFKTRINRYGSLNCKGQRRLYNSLLKHGFNAHKIELIEECRVSDMNKKERFWQEYFDVLSKNGLNCKYQGTKNKKYRHSEETKSLISFSNKGKKHTKKWKIEQSKRKLKTSDETKDKIRKSRIGKKATESTKEKMRIRMIGNTYTKGVIPHNARKVINLSNGEIYDSVSIAANRFGYKKRTLTSWLDGQSNNKSNLAFYEK